MKEHFGPLEMVVEKINYLYTQMKVEEDKGSEGYQVELSLLKRYSTELYDKILGLETGLNHPQLDPIDSAISRAIDAEAGKEKKREFELKNISAEEAKKLDFVEPGKRIMRRIKKINTLSGEHFEIHVDDTVEIGSISDYIKPTNTFIKGSAIPSVVKFSDQERYAIGHEPSEGSAEDHVEEPVQEELTSETTSQEVDEAPATPIEEVEVNELVEEPIAEVEETTVEGSLEKPEEVEEVNAVEEDQPEVEPANLIHEAEAPVEAAQEMELVKDSDWVSSTEDIERIQQDEIAEIAEITGAKDEGAVDLVKEEVTEAIDAEEEESISIADKILASVGAIGTYGAASGIVNNETDTEVLEKTNLTDEVVEATTDVGTETESILDDALSLDSEVDVPVETDVESVVEPNEVADMVEEEAPELGEITEPENELVEALENNGNETEIIEKPDVEEVVDTPEAIVEEAPVEEVIKSIAAVSTFDINNNQKIQFVRELFSGSDDEYNATLNSLEECDTVIEAYTHVNLYVKGKHNWNAESETVREFQQIVKQKFLG